MMNSIKKIKLALLPLCVACLVSSVMMLMHSLSGYQLVGCGAGSGCDSVMGSQWAYIAGWMPVSCAAVTTYIVLILCILFLNSGTSDEDVSLNRLIWSILPVLSGAIVGAAVWFSYLQLAVLHTFCKYCTLTHLLGCVISAMLILKAPLKSGMKSVLVSVGLLSAVAMAAVQVITMPSIVYDQGYVEEALPSFSRTELPSIGPEDAEYELTLMFDFQCMHCRALHRMLPDVVAAADGKIRFLLCPVSLSNACNPYIPGGGVDRFKGSCEMARLALAVWLHSPEHYSEVEYYLLGSGDDRMIISPDEAYAHVASIIGEEALSDARIDFLLNRSFELFGRTSSSAKSGIPRIIYQRKWLVPETDSVDELISVIYSVLTES